MRETYQAGSVVYDKRRKVYYFRYRDAGKRRAVTLGSDKREAQKKADALRLTINEYKPEYATVRAVAQKYIEERMPRRKSTSHAYESYLNNYVIAQFGDLAITDVKPRIVEPWLNGLTVANKTKSHIKCVFHNVLKYAEFLELIEKNPMPLVRIQGGIKRKRKPKVLSVEEFHALLAELEEPVKTMALLAGAMGLSASELTGLRWKDVNFDNLEIRPEVGVVAGVIDDLKTEARGESLPLDPAIATALLNWRERYPKHDSWVFPSPRNPGKPIQSWGQQQRYLKPAGIRAGLGAIGWHTLRHSYRAWLDQSGAPVGVQQKLMRHADIRTTMNIYGDSLMPQKREAHGKVVEMITRRA